MKIVKNTQYLRKYLEDVVYGIVLHDGESFWKISSSEKSKDVMQKD